MHTFNGETFEVNDAVIYSVYPEVANGTANVTATGIIATGLTARELDQQAVSLEAEWEYLFDVRHAVKGDPNYNMQQLHKIANGIGGEVWHSGGGIFGVLVTIDGNQRDTTGFYPQLEVFFGFADDVLGWDINRMPEWEHIGSGTTELTIDQTALVIERCQEVLNTKEIQSI